MAEATDGIKVEFDPSSAVEGTKAKDANDKIPSKTPGIILWATFILLSFWTSGVIFGWPSLVLILNDDAVYSNLCPGGVLDCEERSMQLSLVFSTAFFCLLGGRLAWGLFLDQFGPKLTAASAAAMLALGGCLFAMSSEDFQAYMPAFGLIGLGGPGIHLATFHISNLFPSKKKTVTASVSGVFGTSGLVFLIFRAFHNAGMGSRALWIAYTALAACIGGLYLLIQPTSVFKEGDAVAIKGFRLVKVSATGGKPAPPAKKLTVSEAILNWRMQFLGIFFGICFLHLQFYLGMAQDILGRLGDADHGNAFLLTFNAIGSSALAIFYPVGRMLDRWTFDISFAVSLVLAIGFNVLSFIDNLEIQVVGFVCWCVSRLILFACFFSFIPATVGFPRFGITSGVLSTVAALIGLLNIPLAQVARDRGSHKEVMAGFLVALLLLSSFPLLLWRDRLRIAAKKTAEAAAAAQAAQSAESGEANTDA